MKKITLILAHLVLILGIIAVMPATKSPSQQVFAYSELDESISSEGDKGGPDDSGKKPGSGPKEESSDKETKSVVSTVWGWIKKLVS